MGRRVVILEKQGRMGTGGGRSEARKQDCHIVWFQKISILPPQKGLEIPGGRGVKTQRRKAMYEAKLEFLEGWGCNNNTDIRNMFD